MATKKPNFFNSSKLIITDGEDDAHFIFSFLKKIDAQLLKSVHIHWVAGNTKLLSGNKFEPTENIGMMGLKHMITDPVFIDNVKNVAVIFDAEQNAENSFKSIKSDFVSVNKLSNEPDQYRQKVIFNLPEKIGEFIAIPSQKLNPNVAVFLFDKGDGTGILEDLYLSTLSDEEKSVIDECVEQKLIGCLKTKPIYPINEQKIKVQSFLAFKDSSLKTIGYAATEGKIDFNKSDSLLNPLKKFLLDFANLN